MWNDVIKLVKFTETTNEVGDLVKYRTERDTFVNIKSVGQSEFYQAQAAGLKAEIKFEIADYYDYEDEKLVNYHGRDYRIIRTYRNGLKLELVCEGGVNVST